MSGATAEGLRLGRGAVLTPHIAQETQGTFPFVCVESPGSLLERQSLCPALPPDLPIR